MIQAAIGTPPCPCGGRREHPGTAGRLVTAMEPSTDFTEALAVMGLRTTPGSRQELSGGRPRLTRLPASAGRAGERLRGRRPTGGLRTPIASRITSWRLAVRTYEETADDSRSTGCGDSAGSSGPEGGSGGFRGVSMPSGLDAPCCCGDERHPEPGLPDGVGGGGGTHRQPDVR